MSAYSLHELTTRKELDELLDIRIALPVHGYTAADKARSVAESKDRIWNEYQKQKQAKTGQRWIYARHDASGDIVGGLRLDYASGSALSDGCPKLNLYWWPEGEEVRKFCEEMMQQVYTPRSLWMNRPHGAMTGFVVDPKHRGRGVGSLLLSFQTKELDEKGIEEFVESSEVGRSAYEKAGYQVVMKVASYLPASATDDWKRWYHEFGMAPWYAIWRPKNGRVEPGERRKPRQ